MCLQITVDCFMKNGQPCCVILTNDINSPSSIDCWPNLGSLWNPLGSGRVGTVALRTGWEIVDTEIPLIWSASELDSEQLMV